MVGLVDGGRDGGRSVHETPAIGRDHLSLSRGALDRIDEECIEEHYREDVEAEEVAGRRKLTTINCLAP